MTSPSRTARQAGATTVRVREVVAAFDDAAAHEAAIEALLSAGFDRADISLMASTAAVDEKLPHRYRRIDELGQDENVPRRAYVSTADIGDAQGAATAGLAYIGATVAAGAVVASGGALAAVVAAAVASGGAGGLLGALIGKWVGERHGAAIEAQIEAGGLLLWVTVRDTERERQAMDILARFSGRDVEVHEVTREWGPGDRPLAGIQPDPFLESPPKG